MGTAGSPTALKSTGATLFSELVYEPQRDPTPGVVIGTLAEQDPEDPSDPGDILSAWSQALREVTQLRVREVTFAVHRQVQGGELSGGPSIETVRKACALAKQHRLRVTLLPTFTVEDKSETWRGAYFPKGKRQIEFFAQYREFVFQLASIPEVDRLNIGSELNRMVTKSKGYDFLLSLAHQVRSIAPKAQIGYAANFDAFDNKEHRRFWRESKVDFMGISGYIHVVTPEEAKLVSSVDAVPRDVEQLMVRNWNQWLDQVEQCARSVDLPVIIQEFGLVPENYASVYPFSPDPGDFLRERLPRRDQYDESEQVAVYRSLLRALDGRKSSIQSHFFWSWENAVDRRLRPNEEADESEHQFLNDFAITAESGGGLTLARFLADSQPPSFSQVVTD